MKAAGENNSSLIFCRLTYILTLPQVLSALAENCSHPCRFIYQTSGWKLSVVVLLLKLVVVFMMELVLSDQTWHNILLSISLRF